MHPAGQIAVAINFQAEPSELSTGSQVDHSPTLERFEMRNRFVFTVLSFVVTAVFFCIDVKSSVQIHERCEFHVVLCSLDYVHKMY